MFEKQLLNGSCPVCQKVWSSGSSSLVLAVHIHEQHRIAHGIRFCCSKCPNFRSRWPLRILTHVESAACGGVITFERRHDEATRKVKRTAAQRSTALLSLPPTIPAGWKKCVFKSCFFCTAHWKGMINAAAFSKHLKNHPRVFDGQMRRKGLNRDEENEEDVREGVPAKKTRTTATLPPSHSTTPELSCDGAHGNMKLPDLMACPWCDEKYANGTTAFYFNRHFRTKHRDVPGSIFACSQCSALEFRDYGTLYYHMRKGCGGTAVLRHSFECSENNRADAESGEDGMQMDEVAVEDDDVIVLN